LPTELIVNSDIRHELENEELDFKRVKKSVEEAKKWSLELDSKSLGFIASQKINLLMERFSEAPHEVPLLETIENIFSLMSALPVQLDLWKAQNIYFSIGKKWYNEMKKKSDQGDQVAISWLEHFNKLADYLHVKCV